MSKSARQKSLSAELQHQQQWHCPAAAQTLADTSTPNQCCYEGFDATQVNLVSSTTSTLMQDLHNVPTLTSTELAASHPRLAAEMSRVRHHRLYPLLSGLLMRCEALTAGVSVETGRQALEAETAAFAERQAAAAAASGTETEEDFKEDVELDELMSEAVRVLAIHLTELDKVDELCGDFCRRYISTLQGGSTLADCLCLDSMPDSPASSEPASPSLQQQQLLHHADPSHSYQPSAADSDDFHQLHRAPPTLPLMSPVLIAANDDSDSSSARGGSGGGGGRGVRGALPKRATQILKQWLFQHLVHPYPNEDEKRVLASQCNLSLLQVNNWFINARRRILPPQPPALSGSSASSSNPSSNSLANSASSLSHSTSPTAAASASAAAAAAVEAKRNRSVKHQQRQLGRFWPLSLGNNVDSGCSVGNSTKSGD